MNLKKALKILAILGLVAMVLLNTGCIRIIKFIMQPQFPRGAYKNVELSLAGNNVDRGSTLRFVIWVLPPEGGYTIGPVTYVSTNNRYGSGAMGAAPSAVTWLNTDGDSNGQSDSCLDLFYTPDVGAIVDPLWQAFRTDLKLMRGPNIRLVATIPVRPPPGATTDMQLLRVVAGWQTVADAYQCHSGINTFMDVK